MKCISNTVLIIFICAICCLEASSSAPNYNSKNYQSLNFLIGKNLNQINLNSLILDRELFFNSNLNYSISLNWFNDGILREKGEIVSFGLFYLFNSFANDTKKMTINYNETNYQTSLESNISFYQLGASIIYNNRLFFSEFNELFVFIGPSFNFLLDSRSEEVTITSGDLQDYKINEESNYSDEAYNFMVTLRTGVDYLITEKPGFGLRLMYDFSLLNYYQNQKPLHSISVGLILLPDGK